MSSPRRSLVAVALVAALCIGATACAEPVDPRVAATCEEVRTLQEAVVRLGYAQVDGDEEHGDLGELVGVVLRHARQVEVLAEEAEHERLHELARGLVRDVMPGVAISAAMDGDPRAAAAPAARVTIEMRDECRRVGADE